MRMVEGVRVTLVARVAEWPTDHSPFFSRPELMIDLLDSLARECAA